MQKKRSIFFLCLLTAAAALFFSQCGYRPDGIRTSNSLSSPVEEVTTPEPTAVPVKTVTVTYRHDGKILSTEEVPEGESPSHVPGFSGDRGILTWTLAGAEVDVWNTPVWDPAVYDARLGPQLERNGGFFAAESDGLFHPLNTFTRSDAVRAVYELLDSKPTGKPS